MAMEIAELLENIANNACKIILRPKYSVFIIY
jgi:hypothetical protein